MSISERIADMPALMRYLFPAAKSEKQGQKLRSGDISGAPGGSCSIDARSGRWKDFATGEAGDAIDLLVARGLAHDASDAYHWLETGGWLSLDAPRPAPAAPPPPPARRELPPAPMDKHRAPTRKQLLDYAAYDGITLSEQAIPCFTYRRADGRPVMVVTRYPTPAGKALRRWRWNGRRWWPGGTEGAVVPLYRLPALLEAPDAPVVILEGEAATEAAAIAPICAGRVAICALGGSSPEPGTDWSPLRGRDVLIAPDADDAGRRHLHAAVAAARQAGADRVRWVPPGALYQALTGQDTPPPRGWDIADAPPQDGVDGDLGLVLCARSGCNREFTVGPATARRLDAGMPPFCRACSEPLVSMTIR